jgi:hypothetical protein
MKKASGRHGTLCIKDVNDIPARAGGFGVAVSRLEVLSVYLEFLIRRAPAPVAPYTS